ncbi:hypothetical protein [Tetragenococcus koreensis]|uniref:DUF5105 domain-containing protein n=1 Tax=Tetragenococcus koreensis TaxID=290335 RepID=A0AAN4UBC5_9ENTE|nr:hypothetical protein [Tetragenococcus koreensis]MCF1615445.1 hypothetical protein [Tetragenococcus koreensis]MCF1617770.1 hypothetical protein [Tetragenococcus koreensis]MCF1622553.1 hypothetical protein [Tetragenococcus koreensis]MCF1625261.1 hypothetical protein [Tetragenococcus koreensis]MCF1627939.1 hypothetical protein [Tetragenococcus koreensis]
MKKVIKGTLVVLLVTVLTGCSNLGAEDLAEYVDVDFSGMDTKGTADYSIDEDALLKDVYDVDIESEFPDEETLQEIENLEDSMKVNIDKTDNLSNGDNIKVTANVNEDKIEKVKSGEKEFEVKGLSKPKTLTSEDVEKNLVVNFTGVSGQGEVQADNTFDEPLDSLDFTFENDGKLKNDDQAEIVLSKEDKQQLIDMGYLTEKDFAPAFKVEGLDKVAEQAQDIANLDDIKRMIEEEAKRTYKDKDTEFSFGSKYEINQEKWLYRPFPEDNSEDEDDFGWTMGEESTDSGNLLSIYSIKEYSGGDKKELKEEVTAVIGYSDILLDEDNKANVSELTEIHDEKDDSYSLKSVIQLYEGEGYQEVK